jgi:hypothetical protein
MKPIPRDICWAQCSPLFFQVLKLVLRNSRNACKNMTEMNIIAVRQSIYTESKQKRKTNTRMKSIDQLDDIERFIADCTKPETLEKLRKLPLRNIEQE